MLGLLKRMLLGHKGVRFRRFDQVGLKEAESTMNEISMAEFQEFIHSDQRVMDLASVMSWPTWNLILDRRLTIVHDEYTDNLYAGGVVCRERLEEAARIYCGRQLNDGELASVAGYIPEGRISHGPSTSVCFVKEFSDDVVQFITFGQWWASERGYSRSMFGNIVQRDERPYASSLI